jgi:hypothetical protein
MGQRSSSAADSRSEPDGPPRLAAGPARRTPLRVVGIVHPHKGAAPRPFGVPRAGGHLRCAPRTWWTSSWGSMKWSGARPFVDSPAVCLTSRQAVERMPNGEERPCRSVCHATRWVPTVLSSLTAQAVSPADLSAGVRASVRLGAAACARRRSRWSGCSSPSGFATLEPPSGASTNARTVNSAGRFPG